MTYKTLRVDEDYGTLFFSILKCAQEDRNLVFEWKGMTVSVQHQFFSDKQLNKAIVAKKLMLNIEKNLYSSSYKKTTALRPRAQCGNWRFC